MVSKLLSAELLHGGNFQDNGAVMLGAVQIQ